MTLRVPARLRNASDDGLLKAIMGRRVRLPGDHPFAGSSAVVVGWDPRIGVRVALKRGDAMDGHECFVTKPAQFREEIEGLDW